MLPAEYKVDLRVVLHLARFKLARPDTTNQAIFAQTRHPVRVIPMVEKLKLCLSGLQWRVLYSSADVANESVPLFAKNNASPMTRTSSKCKLFGALFSKQHYRNSRAILVIA